MIRIYLILLLIIGLFWGLRQLKRLPAQQLSIYLRNFFIIVLVLIVLLLTMSGRLNGIFALIGLAIAGIMRSLPLLFRYAPQLQKLWFLFQSSKAQGNQHQENQRQTQGQNIKDGMSVAEAYEILGLKVGSSRQEIIMAHKKLMQKNHPDRGGSDYLATKINCAKTVLLNQ